MCYAMETGGPRNENVAPLAVPEEDDDDSIDTQFIHWGYVNCCQTVANGKKVKKEAWNTYWLELCGSTLRFYRDSSLGVEYSLTAPPSTPIYILEENETKGAFFSLKNADVKVLSDGKFSNSFHKRSKKSVAPKVFRRHLFQLKLRQIHSTYVFQGPSHSAMLRWVMKIQESLDAYELVDKSDSIEQRLKFARGIMRKKSEPVNEVNIVEIDGAVDSSFDAGFELDDVQKLNPSLSNLKSRLAMKRELIWQFEMQIIDFLGRGKGAFKRNEFTCSTKKDYILVPGQVETFVPAGTNVYIFGQLPNRRWRCLVERDELLKSMNESINAVDCDAKSGEDDHLSSGIRTKDIEMLRNLRNNLPEYPLIGCLPSSILNLKSDKQDNSSQDDITKHGMENTIEIMLTECLTDSDVESLDSRRNSETSIGDLKVAFSPGSADTSEAETDVSDISDNVRLRGASAGIVIRKKLRQKGISIIVGSSSSEDEDENEDVK